MPSCNGLPIGYLCVREVPQAKNMCPEVPHVPAKCHKRRICACLHGVGPAEGTASSDIAAASPTPACRPRCAASSPPPPASCCGCSPTALRPARLELLDQGGAGDVDTASQ